MPDSTLKLGLALLWIASSSLQYGFHISALNSSQESLICQDSSFAFRGLWGFPTCVRMSTFSFGLVTASYTLGGFFSSVIAGRLADSQGRRKTAVIAAAMIVLGGSIMSVGSSVFFLVMGRVLIGLACGISTVLVPLYVSEVAPNRGGLAILTQLSICAGILLAQSISIPLSEPKTGKWRLITLVSVAVALIQILTSPFMVETGSKRQGPIYDLVEDAETDPLNHGEGNGASRTSAGHADSEDSLSLSEVYMSKDLATRHSFWTLVLSQVFQQTSGINAVMYYSVGILTAVNPANAKAVALFVAFVNFVMTIPAVLLIDRLGRRALLLISLSTMSLSSIVLAFSINNSMFLLASVCIVLFVATFSIGLGPIPFVLMGELPPPKARSATASAALVSCMVYYVFIDVAVLCPKEGANWSLNFIIVGLARIGSLLKKQRLNLLAVKRLALGQNCGRFAIISAIGWAVMARRLPARIVPITPTPP